MRTSYSAIESYKSCPQRYKFQEVDHIRVPKSREAMFGSLVHETLHFMFKSDPLFPTLDEVVAHFRTHWPSKEKLAAQSLHDHQIYPWTDDEEKLYFEEGVRMLKKFYEKNAPWNFSVIDLESRFTISLTDEKTGAVHILAGIIDRIDKPTDDSYEIIDYKTAKRMPSQQGIDENLQLSLYALGLQTRWPHLKAEDIKLSLYFMRHGEKLSTKPSQELIEKTKKQILATINEIETKLKDGKPFDPMPGPLCNWCGYRPLCPAWKHLYRKKQEIPPQEEVDDQIKEYFALKKTEKKNEKRLGEIQAVIKDYMAREGVTRVFSDEGTITKKTIQRYAYDYEKVKAVLSPLGRWEELLKTDDTKLKRMLKQVPDDIREAIEETRSVAREYAVLAASEKKIGVELKEDLPSGPDLESKEA
ncbi:MAG: PD-(D/E)XK nuclease family protein [bacterium]|nr:PD-(D/E)XK nuclease family protein [bacterium]MDZ4260048.1 PD-(D/E)XK nuclease family protein [Candidatus Sungbacteria bacterium]